MLSSNLVVRVLLGGVGVEWIGIGGCVRICLSWVVARLVGVTLSWLGFGGLCEVG